MYAVIKTGGKQYRVQPGDLLVVEKLEGEVGAQVAFDHVLMVGGEGGDVVVGEPTVNGAVVTATLIETRKGDKVKIFKKIRRQGYRRTRGHRQLETVLRVTGLEAGKITEKWDGVVDLTPKAVLDARARGLAPRIDAVTEVAAEDAPAPKKTKAKAAEAETEVVATAADAVEDAAPKKTRAKKAKSDAAPEGDAGSEA